MTISTTARRITRWAVVPAAVGLGLSLSALAAPTAEAAGYTCNGYQATIVGTNGSNDIEGTSGRDVIVALGGHDEIDGNGGNDVICAGAGNDEVDGGSGNDWIDGGSGHDDLEGSSGRDTIKGGSGNDHVEGESGRDKVYGQLRPRPGRGRHRQGHRERRLRRRRRQAAVRQRAPGGSLGGPEPLRRLISTRRPRPHGRQPTRAAVRVGVRP